jgi:hypothetical protein
VSRRGPGRGCLRRLRARHAVILLGAVRRWCFPELPSGMTSVFVAHPRPPAATSNHERRFASHPSMLMLAWTPNMALRDGAFGRIAQTARLSCLRCAKSAHPTCVAAAFARCLIGTRRGAQGFEHFNTTASLSLPTRRHSPIRHYQDMFL